MAPAGALNRWRAWAGIAVGTLLLLLWLLNDILQPFVVGAVVAYLLIAVPVAAMIGVLVRHLMGRYRASTLYRGTLPS